MPNPCFGAPACWSDTLECLCDLLQASTAAQERARGGEVIDGWEISPQLTPAGFRIHRSSRIRCDNMTGEVGFHVILTTALTGMLLVAVLALLCYFTCRLTGSLSLGGPGRF